VRSAGLLRRDHRSNASDVHWLGDASAHSFVLQRPAFASSSPVARAAGGQASTGHAGGSAEGARLWSGASRAQPHARSAALTQPRESMDQACHVRAMPPGFDRAPVGVYSSVSSLGAEGGGGPPSACGPTRAAHRAQARSLHGGPAFATQAKTRWPSCSTSRSKTRLHPLAQACALHRPAEVHCFVHIASGPAGGASSRGTSRVNVAQAPAVTSSAPHGNDFTPLRLSHAAAARYFPRAASPPTGRATGRASWSHAILAAEAPPKGFCP
jgi:hypothetical protein